MFKGATFDSLNTELINKSKRYFLYQLWALLFITQKCIDLFSLNTAEKRLTHYSLIDKFYKDIPKGNPRNGKNRKKVLHWRDTVAMVTDVKCKVTAAKAL